MGNQSSVDMTDYQRQGLNKIKGNQPRNNLPKRQQNIQLPPNMQQQRRRTGPELPPINQRSVSVSRNQEPLTYNNVNRRIDRFEQDASIRREQFEKEQQEIRNFFDKKEEERKRNFERELSSFEDEYDPYQVLNISNNANIDTIKKSYRKLSLIAHPDKGGDPDVFRILTQAYCYLMKKHQKNVYRERTIEDFQQEKEEFMDSQRGMRNTQMEETDFKLDKFNNVFEEHRLSDINDDGYGDMMNKEDRQHEPMKYDIEKNKVFGEKFNKKVFNDVFTELKKKENSGEIVVYREPEAVVSGKLTYQELGQGKINDFGNKNITSNMGYTDYKQAHTSGSKLIDPNHVQFKKYKNVDEYKQARSKISHKMSEADKRKYALRKKREEEEEEERLKRLEYSDAIAEKQFNKLNRLFIGN